ncbi:MAG: purine-nucleoside phosphorylase [Hyphomicrobiales bacterium]
MTRGIRSRGDVEPFDADEALRVARRRTTIVPRVGLVLGSGFGAIADGVAWDAALPFDEIPGLPRSTVPGHSGRLLIGRWSGRPVAVAQGRSHLYEGYDAETVTRVVRLMAALGARALVLTNAAGGIAPRMAPGSLMLVEDQVNLQWRAPGRPGDAWPGDEAGGPRGLASRPVYAEELAAKAAHAAVVAGVRLDRGVLGVMLGPSYETPAEIAMLERMGADAVCMSTAAEAAAAAALGVPCVAISCITNWAAGKSPRRLAHAEVTAAVAETAAPLKRLLERLVLAIA